MKIEKRSSKSYRVRKQVNGQTINLKFDFKPTQKEIALALAEKIESQVPKGTFEYFATKYVDERSNVLSPSSVLTYRNLINRLSKEFRGKSLANMTQSDVQKEINDYARTHSPKTTRSLHGFISSVFASFRPSFVLRTTLPQKIVKPYHLPQEDEIKALLDKIKDTEDSIGIQLGILSLRAGEICALELSDLKGNELSINKVMVYNHGWVVKPCPKTDASTRIVYLPDALVEEINQKGYFFPYTPKKLNLHLQKYLEELGIEKFVFHSLRHYFASYGHALGIPEAELMAMGGWKSDFVFKQIYRSEFEDKRKDSARKLAGSIIG